MVASYKFTEFLREQPAPLGHISFFDGCLGRPVFCNGFMLGMIADNTFYFRVDDLNRADFAEAQYFQSLSYEKQGRMIDLSFWRAPDRLFDDPDEFLLWATLALGGGASGCREEKAATSTLRDGTELLGMLASASVPSLTGPSLRHVR